MTRPTNLAEWVGYVGSLSGQPLFSQAVAANTQGFARGLVAEGATMADVEQIMLLFVRQLRATGTKVPGGGTWDLMNMAMIDPIARRGPTMSEEQAELLEVQYQPSTDEFDDFELEAAFDG